MPSDFKKTVLINPVIKAIISGASVFVLVLGITIFISFQQYKFQQKEEQEELQRELSHVKERFRSILYENIGAANSMAVIYKEYGTPKNFDSIAAQLMQYNKDVEMINLAVDGIITNVYPYEENKSVLGIRLFTYSKLKTETLRAKEKKEVFFAGPRKIIQGGTGILGKVPIVIDDKLKALCTVLTKMETISKALQVDASSNNIYAYVLLKKTPGTDIEKFYLTAARPATKSQVVSTDIPEGDWELQVSFSVYDPRSNIPYSTLVMGLLLASLAGVFTHRGVLRPYALKKIIDLKTRELATKEEYFRTLIETSTDAIVLINETGKVLYQTPSTERISGYSLEEIQSIDGRTLVHPQHREISEAVFQDILATPGGRAVVKFKLRHKNGNYIWAEGSYRNLLQEESVKAIVFNYSDITERIVAESKLLSTKIQLNERVKELSTIYRVSTILQNNDQKTSKAFSEIAETLPQGWQYPDICEAKIEFNGNTFTSSNYKTSSFKQVAEFSLQDGRSGYIEIIYTQEKPPAFEGPFLKEERALLNTLAEMIQVYLNKKAHQESLLRSEARFRGAFEYSAIGMTVVSLDGNFQMVNHALSEITGYSEQELLSMNFQKITHPDDLESNISLVQDTLAGKADYFRKEKRYIHKNGSIVWVNLNVSLIRDKNGEPLYFVGQIENITARRESEMKFRNLVEKSAVGVYIFQNGKFVYVNPWVAEETGYSENELLTFSMVQLAHPDFQEMVNKAIDRRTKGYEGIIRYEVKAIKKTGETIWLEIFGNGTYFEGKPAVIGTMVDITDRKAAYEDLVKSEANLKSIFNNTQIAFLLLNKQLDILAFNQYLFDIYLRQTGLKLQVGANFLELTLLEKRKEIKTLYNKVLTSGQPLQYESVYNNKERPEYVDITLNPVISNGEVIGLCMASFNITKRKTLENERQKMVSELIERNKKMEEFAVIVSHNLRAPLSNILGLSHMFKDDITASEEKFIVNGIKISAEKLDDVVKEMNQILYFQNTFSEQNTTIYLDALIEEIKQEFKATITSSHAEISYDFTAVKELFSNKSFIYNIFYNLLSNSLKFRQPDKIPQIRIWTNLEPGNIVIHFQDNGIGIDMEKYGDQVFGLNKRFHPTISGKGLGLFMVKAQVESLNGTIEVESNINEGTTFTISFPIS